MGKQRIPRSVLLDRLVQQSPAPLHEKKRRSCQSRLLELESLPMDLPEDKRWFEVPPSTLDAK
jgi:hypothetical protein